MSGPGEQSLQDRPPAGRFGPVGGREDGKTSAEGTGLHPSQSSQGESGYERTGKAR